MQIIPHPQYPRQPDTDQRATEGYGEESYYDSSSWRRGGRHGFNSLAQGAVLGPLRTAEQVQLDSKHAHGADAPQQPFF
eukprot:1142801-Pelagomonas_calceolata.AAC.2